MPSNDFGNSDFGYSDTGVAGSGYQAGQVPGQGGIQDSPPGNYGGAPGQAGYQNAPGQFNPAGYPNAPGQFNPAGYQNAPGQFNPAGSPNQFGYQPPQGPGNYQAGQGQPGYLGNPGPFGQGQPGYQGTPTPIGYQDPSQFGQPGWGNRQMWSGAGPSVLGAGGGIGRALLSFFVGPGLFGRRGRNSYFWYIRIAFWLIVIGICLYVGFTTHHWITTCTGNNCGD